MSTDSLWKSSILRLSIAVLCVALTAAAQIPASFNVPIIGYLFDVNYHSIRPIVGILGNSRIEAPLELGLTITQAAILPDHRYAIVGSLDFAEALVLNIEDPARSVRVVGAPSSFSAIRTSADGSAAALYYQAAKQILVVNGLPDNPAVREAIDISFTEDAVSRFAIADGGSLGLLAFSSQGRDFLYRWTRSTGPRFLTTFERIADVALVASDAVIADSGADQILLIRNVREQAVPIVVADSRDGVSQPVAVSVSSRNVIYVGNAGAGTVIALEASGHILRTLSCSCMITALSPLRDSAFQLTERLDRPIFLLDGSSATDRILFVPGLPKLQPVFEATAVPAQGLVQ